MGDQRATITSEAPELALRLQLSAAESMTEQYQIVRAQLMAVLIRAGDVSDMSKMLLVLLDGLGSDEGQRQLCLDPSTQPIEVGSVCVFDRGGLRTDVVEI